MPKRTHIFRASFYGFSAIAALCLLILLSACNRETGFGIIKVQGKVIHFVTKQPISGQKVSMYAKRWYGGRDGNDTFLGETTTDANGDFELKTKTARTDFYKLYYGGGAGPSGDTTFESKKISVKIGTVFSGDYSTVFNVHLKSTSSNCLWTLDNNLKSLKVKSGSDTNLFYTRTFKYSNAKLHRTVFAFVYRINPCASSDTSLTNDYHFSFGIADTLRADIFY